MMPRPSYLLPLRRERLARRRASAVHAATLAVLILIVCAGGLTFARAALSTAVALPALADPSRPMW